MNEEQFLRAMEQGDIKKAQGILATLKDVIPRTRFLYFEGLVHDCLGEPEEALKKFNMALVLHLSDPPIWLAKARVLMDLGKLDMARRAVDRACRLSPGDPPAHLLHADILYRMKDYQGAMVQIDAALELASADPEILTMKGILVSITEEDYVKALSFFDRALTSDEEHAPAWTNRGVVLRRIGDRDGAIYSFQKALMLDGEDQTAREMLERMGAEGYIIPPKKERSEPRISSRTRYLIDEAPKGYERRRPGSPGGREPGQEKRPEPPIEWDENEEEELEELVEEEGSEEKVEPPPVEGDDEQTDDTEVIDEALEELDELEEEFEEDDAHTPVESAPQHGTVSAPKRKKTIRILDLNCPRCGSSFQVKVRGRTKFQCPSCGLAGEIE
ncbi:MAG: tetratricopeptide repeat protein [Candidatus Thermoplasmatota archaeon]|nr:tetratricopeptide repeat protein [Candidatus Thermoplasmatota archaeon]